MNRRTLLKRLGAAVVAAPVLVVAATRPAEAEPAEVEFHCSYACTMDTLYDPVQMAWAYWTVGPEGARVYASKTGGPDLSRDERREMIRVLQAADVDRHRREADETAAQAYQRGYDVATARAESRAYTRYYYQVPWDQLTPAQQQLRKAAEGHTRVDRLLDRMYKDDMVTFADFRALALGDD